VNSEFALSYSLEGEIDRNPFDPTEGAVRMRITISEAGHVRAKVYDLAGQFVRSVFDNDASAGQLDIEWDGRSSGGDVAANGVYFCHMQVDGTSGFERTFTIVLKKN
jgi:flagellar hook assembly protein FlgD